VTLGAHKMRERRIKNKSPTTITVTTAQKNA
jgi:hypothetical protein